MTINYIRAMENLLTTGDSGVNSFSEMVRNPIRPDEVKHASKFADVTCIDVGDEASPVAPNNKPSAVPAKNKPGPQAIRRSSKKHVKHANKSGGGGVLSSVPPVSNYNPPNQQTAAGGYTLPAAMIKCSPSSPTSSSSSPFFPKDSTPDSGISTASGSPPSSSSSSASPPSFEMAARSSSKLELLDPLLGGTAAAGFGKSGIAKSR